MSFLVPSCLKPCHEIIVFIECRPFKHVMMISLFYLQNNPMSYELFYLQFVQEEISERFHKARALPSAEPSYPRDPGSVPVIQPLGWTPSLSVSVVGLTLASAKPALSVCHAPNLGSAIPNSDHLPAESSNSLTHSLQV